MDAVKPILRMAAIEFTKAVFETRFMEEIYDDSQFKKLESGIEKICNTLKQEVFGEGVDIEKQEWI